MHIVNNGRKLKSICLLHFLKLRISDPNLVILVIFWECQIKQCHLPQRQTFFSLTIITYSFPLFYKHWEVCQEAFFLNNVRF